MLLSQSATTDAAGFGTPNGLFRVELMLETPAVYDILGGYPPGRDRHIYPRSSQTPESCYFCTRSVIADDLVFFSFFPSYISTACLSTGSGRGFVVVCFGFPAGFVSLG
jgi:hypothetical protein